MTDAKTAWPSTVFSDCGVYRYTLFRPSPLDLRGLPPLLACLLNPSTATAEKDDPTTRRMLKFAHSNGFGDYMAINPFAFRSPKPKVMMAHLDPIGPDNDSAIVCAQRWCIEGGGKTIVAWGDGGTHQDRDQVVLELLSDPLYCFGLTKAGNPHFPTPFIQPYQLQEFRP